ncbi:MAG TPA: hypothetical protein VLT89_02215 [Usitatibacter sp.]|nr:hypothetical protein [Usitatibacter sp.]
MKTALLLFLLSAASALAQPNVSAPVPPRPGCGECGEVRSIRSVTKQLGEVPSNESKPSGLVATVPLGGGGKAKVGSSERVGRDEVKTSTTWELIVRLDDGRFRIFILDKQPDLRQGDKVRIEDGQVVLRTD